MSVLNSPQDLALQTTRGSVGASLEMWREVCDQLWANLAVTEEALAHRAEFPVPPTWPTDLGAPPEELRGELAEIASLIAALQTRMRARSEQIAGLRGAMARRSHAAPLAAYYVDRTV